MPRVLITGGAGYVGSHVTRHIRSEGHDVVVLDDLSNGYREAVEGPVVQADLRDRDALDDLLSTGFDAVVHFAARMSVPHSVADPLGYFDVNVAGTCALLDAMLKHGCDTMVFSSTCAVYGVPEVVPITEDTPFAPISPYGETKAVVERMLELARGRGAVRSACLRYFNAAGAASDGWLGESHVPETHLIPLALEAAATGETMKVFGTDHDTPDGTCLRDYIHVEDLASVHARALDRLLSGDPGGAWNVGTGDGASVREVLDTIEEITGLEVKRVDAPRRVGDPPALVADVRRAEAELGWRATHDLPRIIEDAWRWHQAPRFGPGSLEG